MSHSRVRFIVSNASAVYEHKFTETHVPHCSLLGDHGRQRVKWGGNCSAQIPILYVSGKHTLPVKLARRMLQTLLILMQRVFQLQLSHLQRCWLYAASRK